jgi:hypothetical protein
MINFYEWNIKNKLKNIAKKHLENFPDPDYGRLFWNSNLKKVHWVCGDGAGGWKEAERVFDIPEVEKIEVADEYMPSKKEDGWEEIKVK